MEVTIKSPFQYQTDTIIKSVKAESRSISPARLWDLITKGEITEAERIIIQLLFELGFLTSNLLQQCFLNDSIPLEYKRISTADKNKPYRRLLNHLETLGIISTLSLFRESQQVGVKIYSLSTGANKWMQDQDGRYQPIFIKQSLYRGRLFDFITNGIDMTEEILGLLARNQFHIKAINTMEDNLIAFSPTRYRAGILDIAFYQTKSNWNIFMIPLRRAPEGTKHLFHALITLINIIKKSGRVDYSCIILAVESLEHTKAIHPQLQAADLQCIPLCYVTDHHSRNERLVFEHMIHYPASNNVREYETVTIDTISI